MTINSFPIQTRRVNLQKILDAETYAGDAEAARDQSQTARDTAAAEAAATSATNTASSLAGFDLDAIAETKADTAVDVFVYDTSKDSDGGAWRQRTQHTSWYNETLNTATRGSRREFPAVAVIVAESDRVTIYDGDDPSLPMWMVFNRRVADLRGFFSSGAANSVSSVNAQIFFGSKSGGSHDGLNGINFLSDVLLKYSGRVEYNGIENLITNRVFDEVTNIDGSLPLLVSRAVNDVAMTVLPDAPTDPATGLPVPTIAVATDGGVSVIKDDGTVVDSGTTLGSELVIFDNEYGVYYRRNTTTGILWYASQADYEAGDGFGDEVARPTAGTNDFDLLTYGKLSSSDDGFALGGTNTSNGGKLGLSKYAPNTLDFTKGMSALLTSTYNTGWMNGDIKGAFLSDTDDTDLVGSGELVTNGTFDTDTDWTKGTGWTISGGAASFAPSVSGLTSSLLQSISTVVGKVYSVSISTSGSNMGAGELKLIVSGVLNEDINQDGSYDFSFTASSTTSDLDIRCTNYEDVDTASIDNVSVKLADADRSVNNNGLIINGTVSRDPVSSGADLVSYSGFSPSNYLEQPYNSDLDFGTGDFCVMGWVKDPGIGTMFLFDRQDGANTASTRFNVGYNGTEFFSRCGTELTRISGDLNADVFSHVAFVREASTISVYVNGVLVGTDSNNGNISGTVPLIVGRNGVSGGTSNGVSLALLRISATAPTAEQIAKIYEDEKFLFQENAQATLYGTSDAVTALAHDPVTDLLHVGTSDGRSVFQGLRRVDNTTDAVSTAISASNNLIVED